MPNPIVMPKLGQMTEESTVVRWLKREGERVSKGEVLLEIETDKATMEVESFYDGILLKISVGEGRTVPVMTTLGYIGAMGETVIEEPQSSSIPASPPDGPGRETVATATAQAAVTAVADLPRLTQPSTRSERIKISPRAAGLAAARRVDVSAIKGSGPGGRIIERDVLAFIEQAAIRSSIRVVQSSPADTEKRKEPLSQAGEPLSTMRKVIAQRLTQSFTTVPHFYVTVAVDMTEIERFRAEMKSESPRISLTDILIKAVALTLVEYPVCNSRTDGRQLFRNDVVHVGMAVAIDDGLVVPVIRDADRLTLRQVAEQTKALARKARNRELLPEEMTGGTFTISNLGMLDVENFTAIVNPGESAILAVSSTRFQPVVVDHQITVRPMMKMTLSCDHRLIDGALAARFLNAIRRRLEDKKLWWWM